jgi:hypothetical protein
VLYINSNIEDLESIKESRLRTLDCKWWKNILFC